MPKRMIGRRSIRPSAGSKSGMKYVGAGGEIIKNEGEVYFLFETTEGHTQSMIFQIAEANQPQGSVAYFVIREYRVVYDNNITTGRYIDSGGNETYGSWTRLLMLLISSGISTGRCRHEESTIRKTVR